MSAAPNCWPRVLTVVASHSATTDTTTAIDLERALGGLADAEDGVVVNHQHDVLRAGALQLANHSLACGRRRGDDFDAGAEVFQALCEDRLDFGQPIGIVSARVDIDQRGQVFDEGILALLRGLEQGAVGVGRLCGLCECGGGGGAGQCRSQ